MSAIWRADEKRICGHVKITPEEAANHPEWMCQSGEITWNGGNGKGTVKLYRDGKLIDEVAAENVGCEYGEYDKAY